MAQKIPYFKSEFRTSMSAIKEWKLFEGAQGCTRLDLDGVGLSLNKPPPVELHKQVNQPKGPLLGEAGKQMKGWFSSAPSAPPSPKQAQAPKGPVLAEAWNEMQGWGKAAASEKSEPTLPPFDIQDIPSAMEKLGWRKSAELMRQFFAGGLNYSLDQSAESKAINQVGEYYGREFVETKRFTWNWLLGYGAVERALQKLIAPGYIDSTRGGKGSAVAAIKSAIVDCVHEKSRYFMGQIDTMDVCDGDVFALHRRFQFQNSPVSMATFVNTDLGGSLGNFSLYAAVARATVFREDFKQHTVTVTHVYVYAKDNYSFNDKPGEPSQYLGHWNKTGLIYVPAPSFVQLFKGWFNGLPEVNEPYNTTYLEGAEFSVIVGDQPTAENTFYPVRNRDFWNWQMLPRKPKQRGGNVLSFSDLKLIQLSNPLVFPI